VDPVIAPVVWYVHVVVIYDIFATERVVAARFAEVLVGFWR